MNLTTEKEYPIKIIWIFKYISTMPLAILVLSLLPPDPRRDVFIISSILFVPFYLVYAILRRATFHYSIDEKYIVLNQGILGKQQRNVPYGVIQHVATKQDVFDKIFNLASLTIENASLQTGIQDRSKFRVPLFTSGKTKPIELLGFSGNKINIPGLTKGNANALKEIVLQKMKQNSTVDTKSGL